MRQIVLPLGPDAAPPPRIIVGSANGAVVEALEHAAAWPFRTAVLVGPARSGKSLLARWFVESGAGEAIDDADRADETAVFHAWNRAQHAGRALLLVRGEAAWTPQLPDLRSRLGAGLELRIGEPDEAMLAELLALHAEARGLLLDESALAYLVPRCERSHIGAERLVGAIDRLSWERKVPPTLSVWRDATRELSEGASSRLP